MFWQKKKANTINICLAHKDFPESFLDYCDLILYRSPIAESAIKIQIKSEYDKQQSNALGEFDQLLWLNKNYEDIVKDAQYIRLFHYRRFVSKKKIGNQAEAKFVRYIPEYDLVKYSREFSRHSSGELFNTIFDIVKDNNQCVVGQFASAHVVEDIIQFTKYSINSNLMVPEDAFNFLMRPKMIPACSIGIFSSKNLKYFLDKIKQAADFVYDPMFVCREGYQSRNMAFILERYLSHLILSKVESRLITTSFGYHTILSDSEKISISGPIT